MTATRELPARWVPSAPCSHPDPADAVAIVDPAPAVARHAQRVLQERSLANPAPDRGSEWFATSGERAPLERALTSLFGVQSPVHSLKWLEERLVEAA